MKKVATLFLSLLAFTVYAQSEKETIKKPNALINNKKYDSAFKLLETFDPQNTRPDIVLLKEDILLKYFVSSMMHQFFALKDLEKNEDVRDYRGKEGSFSMYAFDADSLLTNLIRLHPNNCKLYKGLGEFYYEANLKYGNEWMKDENELFNLMEENFKKAIDGNCADYLSYYVLGYVYVSQKKYKESIPNFLKSIELKKDYASSHYNLAYAYMYMDDRQNAIKFAKNSLDMYTDVSYKSDAARMLGQVYTEFKDDTNAIKNYELANKIDPGNYYNLKALLDIYVRTGNNKTLKTAGEFLNLDPVNPTIYNDLQEIYYSNKKENDLIEFYKSRFSSFKDNEKVLGSLNFYLGTIYLETDKMVAKDYFMKARENFKTVFDNDHQVFKAIDNGIKRCEE